MTTEPTPIIRLRDDLLASLGTTFADAFRRESDFNGNPRKRGDGTHMLPKYAALRDELYWIMRDRDMSLPAIAHACGVSHSTVFVGVRRHAAVRWSNHLIAMLASKRRKARLRSVPAIPENSGVRP